MFLKLLLPTTTRSPNCLPHESLIPPIYSISAYVLYTDLCFIHIHNKRKITFVAHPPPLAPLQEPISTIFGSCKSPVQNAWPSEQSSKLHGILEPPNYLSNLTACLLYNPCWPKPNIHCFYYLPYFPPNFTFAHVLSQHPYPFWNTLQAISFMTPQWRFIPFYLCSHNSSLCSLYIGKYLKSFFLCACCADPTRLKSPIRGMYLSFASFSP